MQGMGLPSKGLIAFFVCGHARTSRMSAREVARTAATCVGIKVRCSRGMKVDFHTGGHIKKGRAPRRHEERAAREEVVFHERLERRVVDTRLHLCGTRVN